MKLRPFFSFYGAKWQAAPHYPQPKHDLIIEPFAGSAGYSVRNHEKKVLLVERDPTIAALWRYLIDVSPEEILRLPLVGPEDHLDNFQIPKEAKTLIGFWLNRATTAPCTSPSAWMRAGNVPQSFWGESIRHRIASQVDHIRHWVVLEGSYADLQDTTPKATWFVDPPYQKMGRYYRYPSSTLDFQHLAGWCQDRRGQVIVCENEGADWLPFRPFKDIKATTVKAGQPKVSKEVIWTNGI